MKLLIKKKLNVILKRVSKKPNHLETITSLKQRIQVLEMTQSRTENYLNNIIRVIPANIYWKDMNSVILGGNLSHAQQAGFTDPKDVIGKTEHDFVWKDQAEEIIENDRQIIKSGIKRQLEETATLADGEIHTFLTCKEPLRDKNNKIIGIIGVSTDITDFKTLQKELLQSKMIASLAATSAAKAKATAEEEMRQTTMILVGNIVHDLRTPLTTIMTTTTILSNIIPAILEIIEEANNLGATKTKLLNQNMLDYLSNKTPITYIENSMAMINDFINITLAELANAHKSLSSDLTKNDLTKCWSRRIIENTLDSYPFSELDRKKIQANMDWDFYFTANSILVMKLLFNLIKNAFEQISLNGKGEVSITTAKEKNYNLIIVKDTAGGAPPEIVSNFFNAYFTTKKEGTGVGLAFCKRTMQNFGGDITCTSIYGESMEFILKFPA